MALRSIDVVDGPIKWILMTDEKRAPIQNVVGWVCPDDIFQGDGYGVRGIGYDNVGFYTPIPKNGLYLKFVQCDQLFCYFISGKVVNAVHECKLIDEKDFPEDWLRVQGFSIEKIRKDFGNKAYQWYSDRLSSLYTE